jgi:MFS family permease
MRKFSVSNRVLLIICVMYLILYVDRVNISTAAPLIKADLALSNTQLGLAFSAFAYPYALFQLIGGYIGDKFGRRLTLCVSSLIVCVATAATSVVGGLGSLFAARLGLGIGEGSTFPTATRAMSVWIPERRWGFAQGITHSSARLGNAVTPPLIAVLIALVSWRGSTAEARMEKALSSCRGHDVGAFALYR